MILRPLEFAPSAGESSLFVPAWPVVERSQRQKYDACWMITQPSHAALSGEIAGKLRGPKIPALDSELIRAIALHDAGWGPVDAQAITRSRAAKPIPPKSFLASEVAEFLEAWTQSIQIAQTSGPAGGYIVSRHFQRLAEQHVAHVVDPASDRKKLEQFIAHESQRQKKLASKQNRSAAELESLTDVLQLCDLLSLYLCCGARESVEFPEYFGSKLRLTVEDAGYRVDPSLVEPGTRFSFAALRFPARTEISSQEINVVFTQRS